MAASMADLTKFVDMAESGMSYGGHLVPAPAGDGAGVNGTESEPVLYLAKLRREAERVNPGSVRKGLRVAFFGRTRIAEGFLSVSKKELRDVAVPNVPSSRKSHGNRGIAEERVGTFGQGRSQAVPKCLKRSQFPCLAGGEGSHLGSVLRGLAKAGLLRHDALHALEPQFDRPHRCST